MDIDQTLQFFTQEIQREIDSLPESFYNSFKYTSYGSNYTHSITLGFLTKILWKLPGVQHVGVDMHLTTCHGAFRPDVVALASLDPLIPLLFLDYESPNSCDSRIPRKDVLAYREWREQYQRDVPYLIVTTLPCTPKGKWELRYASENRLNSAYKTQRGEIQRNPFAFWYSEYQKMLNNVDLTGIYFFNIDGLSIQQVEITMLSKSNDLA